MVVMIQFGKFVNSYMFTNYFDPDKDTYTHVLFLSLTILSGTDLEY